MDIRDFLENNGYQVLDSGNYYKTQALWRSGSDINSVTVYKNDGSVIDHVSGERFNYKGLISRVLGIEDKANLEEFIQKNNLIIEDTSNQILEPIIKVSSKTFPKEELNLLIEDHTYLSGRGISLGTATQFKAGLFSGQNNRLKDRYVWAILNSKNEIVGYTGRDLTGKKKNKYKHLGVVKNWCWPCYLNIKDIQDKSEIIIVESPVDVTSLFECGIRNVVCSFGLELSFSLINLFLRLNLKKIIIAVNNEESGRGNEAAEKMRNKLLKYFDRYTVEMKLPPVKDFNLLLTTKGKPAIIEWYKQ